MTTDNNESEQQGTDIEDILNEQFEGEFSVNELHEKLLAAEDKVAEQQDKVIRAMAEMENIKRRASRDVENARKYAVEKFASDLLPVVDSLEQGIETSRDASDISALREGMEMTNKMLISTLEKQGLIQVHPMGEKFNPEYHEAMSMVENMDVAEDHVMTVFQKGYQLNGRLVRPARVVVSRGHADMPSIDEKA